MTHQSSENNQRLNEQTRIIKKKNASSQNSNQLNKSNEKDSNLKLLPKIDANRTNNNVSFHCPRQYPIMSWFVDSGASEHMVNSEEYLDESRLLDERTRVVVAKAGVELEAVRVGTVRGHSIVNGQRVDYLFRDVLFVPDLQANLFSVTKAVSLKLKVTFENRVCKILKRDKEVAVAIREDKLYELKILLHASYCTPLAFITPKLLRVDKAKTGKYSTLTDSSFNTDKKSVYVVEVNPKQKMYFQEL